MSLISTFQGPNSIRFSIDHYFFTVKAKKKDNRKFQELKKGKRTRLPFQSVSINHFAQSEITFSFVRQILLPNLVFHRGRNTFL